MGITHTFLLERKYEDFSYQQCDSNDVYLLLFWNRVESREEKVNPSEEENFTLYPSLGESAVLYWKQQELIMVMRIDLQDYSLLLAFLILWGYHFTGDMWPCLLTVEFSTGAYKFG